MRVYSVSVCALLRRMNAFPQKYDQSSDVHVVFSKGDFAMSRLTQDLKAEAADPETSFSPWLRHESIQSSRRFQHRLRLDCQTVPLLVELLAFVAPICNCLKKLLCRRHRGQANLRTNRSALWAP